MNDLIVKALKSHVRVVDGNGVQKVEFYDEFGVKLVINKSELSDGEWNAFKENFQNF